MQKIKSEKIYFIENLTLSGWAFYALPYLLANSGRADKQQNRIYFFNSSKPGLVLSRLTARFLNMHIEKLSFRVSQMRDEEGKLLWCRVSYSDMGRVQKAIENNPLFEDTIRCASGAKRMFTYLSKQAVLFNRQLTSESIWHAIAMLQIAYLKARDFGITPPGNLVIFMNKRIWQSEVNLYARGYGIKVIPVNNMGKKLRGSLSHIAGPVIKGVINTLKTVFINFLERKNNIMGVASLEKASPKLATPYCGYLNLGCPEFYSDLFFWQNSELSASDIIIFFSDLLDPLDEKKYEEIKSCGAQPLVLNRRATAIPLGRVFYYPFRSAKINTPKIKFSNSQDSFLEKRWLALQVDNYSIRYEYWRNLFKKYNIKAYVTWYRFDAMHCVIADALESIGGVTAIYQRALDEFPSPDITVNTDVVFGFSKNACDVEAFSNSVIPYYIITGYNGDHRFPLLKKYAQEVRDALKQKGVTKIMGFFDENSGGDPRWSPGAGHEFTRKNYSFLLERVLAKPWFGLIIKPKAYWSLQRRLGKVTELLNDAVKTGRCFIFEKGPLHNAFPPAVAALASDVAVHGHLCATTAGFESALSGTPTLLMDQEGMPYSLFYKLGKGRVVFTDWESLWKSCNEHWQIPTGIPGFGDWSLLLDELDPFRDGRAAERIGTYLKWLLEGLNTKVARDTVLADVAERYCRAWGKDKVINISSRAKQG